MRYTLWLDGHLLGETHLEHNGPVGNQRLGVLSPTAHGVETLPGLCGFLARASAVKETLLAQGVDPDKNVDRTMELLATTSEGARFTEMVRMLSQLELRTEGGERASFHTVIVTDLHELAELSESFNADDELARGSPRYIVSAIEGTLAAIRIRSDTRKPMKIVIDPN